jgi:hypothetical protein
VRGVNLAEARLAERDKYVRAYATGGYRIKPARLKDAVSDLSRLTRGSFLDVSCGLRRPAQVRQGARAPPVPWNGDP